MYTDDPPSYVPAFDSDIQLQQCISQNQTFKLNDTPASLPYTINIIRLINNENKANQYNCYRVRKVRKSMILTQSTASSST